MKVKKSITGNLLILLIISVVYSGYSQQVRIRGKRTKWNRIELNFNNGSTLNETSPATFKNNRMDVIFRHPATNTTLRVPGFFNADGKAQNSHATSGKLFRAYFRPNQTGNWTYEVLFYRGANVASVLNINQLPAPIHRVTGSMDITPTPNNIAATDLRRKGRLTVQTTGSLEQRRYLKFAENNEFFLKVGPDSPENLLDYDEFDFVGPRLSTPNGQKPNTNFQHTFSAHEQDFVTRNPTWSNANGNGRLGQEIIGAINFVRNRGMNSISMSLFGGDALNVYPWIRRNNTNLYDVSKLAQWQIVFNYAERQGLLLHFKLSEKENAPLTKREFPSVDKSGFTRQGIIIYYREMIARFGHHLAVEWNIGEEFSAGANEARIRSTYLRQIDAYKSHRVIHNGQNNNPYINYLSSNVDITGFSIQSPFTNDDFRGVYNSTNTSGSRGNLGIRTLINTYRNQNQAFVLAIDEQNPGSTGLYTSGVGNNGPASINTPVRPQARTRILWKTLIAGGAGVMWYGGGGADFKTDDYRRFNVLFRWSKIAVDFFKNNDIEFWKMRNMDNLVSRNNINCLAEVGRAYVIYLEAGGSTNLRLPNGQFDVKWYNPRNGGNLQNGSITRINGGANRSIGTPPSGSNGDWVALVRRVGSFKTTNLGETAVVSKKEPSILVYPNPTKGNVSIENVGNAFINNVEVFDQTGKVIYTKEHNNVIVDLDLGSISSGIYFIKIVSGSSTDIKKLVIK